MQGEVLQQRSVFIYLTGTYNNVGATTFNQVHVPGVLPSAFCLHRLVSAK